MDCDEELKKIIKNIEELFEYMRVENNYYKKENEKLKNALFRECKKDKSN